MLRDEHVGADEKTVPARWSGPPLHHHEFDEAIYVLEGELTFQAGGVVTTHGPGGFAFARRGEHHTGANLGDREARYLIVTTPVPGGRVEVGPPIDPGTRTDALRVSRTGINVLLRGEESGGAMSVMDNVVPADAKGPFLHVHDFDEAFYLVEGELVFQVGEELVTVRRGELAFAPRGVPHTFTNRSGEAARFVLVCTPAGFERHFARIAAKQAGVEPPSWALQPVPEVTRVGPQIG